MTFGSGLSLNFNLNAGKEHSIALEENMIYDLLVVGGGPAGLNAALYAKRKGLTVGLVTKTLGGQVKDTSSVENYLGTEWTTGEGLVEGFVKHLKTLEVPILEGSMVISHEVISEEHRLTLDTGQMIQSKSVLIALGSQPKRLEVEGEDDFAGRGVAYCAICDGPLFKDKTVVVAGGGNSAVEAAIDLAKLARQVKLVHRSQLRADPILIDALKKLNNVEIFLETPIQAIVGENKVTGVSVIQNDRFELLETDGVFVEIGHKPNLGPFKGIVETNEKGEILVNCQHETSLHGLYAAGDVTQVAHKQIIIAAADGAAAALDIAAHLNKR